MVFLVSTVFGATDKTSSQPSRYDSMIVVDHEDIHQSSSDRHKTYLFILNEIISTAAPGFKAVSSLDFSVYLPENWFFSDSSCI